MLSLHLKEIQNLLKLFKVIVLKCSICYIRWQNGPTHRDNWVRVCLFIKVIREKPNKPGSGFNVGDTLGYMAPLAAALAGPGQ